MEVLLRQDLYLLGGCQGPSWGLLQAPGLVSHRLYHSSANRIQVELLLPALVMIHLRTWCVRFEWFSETSFR